jgi:hypothetical protein
MPAATTDGARTGSSRVTLNYTVRDEATNTTANSPVAEMHALRSTRRSSVLNADTSVGELSDLRPPCSDVTASVVDTPKRPSSEARLCTCVSVLTFMSMIRLFSIRVDDDDE